MTEAVDTGGFSGNCLFLCSIDSMYPASIACTN